MAGERQVHYIFVEGCIGAGKSTLCERVAPHLRAMGVRNLLVVLEPLERWRNCQGHNVLDLFYTDARRWALAFQTHAMATRIAAVREAIEAHEHVGDGDLVVLCERSVHTDRHVFVEMLCEDGTLSAAERAMYDTAYEFYRRFFYPGNEAGVIYLEATVERCVEQMRRRDRSEEAGVPVEYLRRLVAKHEEVVPHKWHGDVLRLRAEALGRLPDDERAALQCAETVGRFITKVCGVETSTKHNE